MTIYHVDSVNKQGNEVSRETTSMREAIEIAKEHSKCFEYAVITAPGEVSTPLRHYEHGKLSLETI